GGSSWVTPSLNGERPLQSEPTDRLCATAHVSSARNIPEVFPLPFVLPPLKKRRPRGKPSSALGRSTAARQPLAPGSVRLCCESAARHAVPQGITWVLVYRTDKYKRLKAEVEKQSKKLEKKKETITESAGRQQKKKIERQEEKLKNNNRDLSMVRMKSMFAIGFCFTALMGMFNSIFDGRVVAKLPFIPLSYIQGLSHRNLLGEDYTDCSFIFLYILCTMSIRQNIQKMLGLAPSRAATKQAGGFLGPPPQAGKFS
uniref:Calcium load-activated calcium channel n=18 Tax=Neognathae TaxID=8825 RepID=A0A8V0YWS8_CHICK